VQQNAKLQRRITFCDVAYVVQGGGPHRLRGGRGIGALVAAWRPLACEPLVETVLRMTHGRRDPIRPAAAAHRRPSLWARQGCAPHRDRAVDVRVAPPGHPPKKKCAFIRGRAETACTQCGLSWLFSTIVAITTHIALFAVLDWRLHRGGGDGKGGGDDK
jgi:hypothetical protein